jgi:protein SCO1/2
MRRGTLAAGVAVLCVAAVAATLALTGGGSGRDVEPSPAGAYRGSRPPARLEMPTFALRDYTGAVVRSSDLRGKVVAMTFLDSQCTDSCPVIARQVAVTADRLTSRERDRVAFVAISTDPAEDTPRSIRAFLARHGALGTLRYLDGSEDELRRLWQQFAILSSLQSGKDDLHSAPVRIYDSTGRWVATQHAAADLTPANLTHDLRVALKTMSA